MKCQDRRIEIHRKSTNSTWLRRNREEFYRASFLNCLTIFSIPAVDLSATLEASIGEYLTTSALSTLCHIGRITFLPSTSALTASPSNSSLVQCLSKKLELKMTRPNLQFA